MQIHSVLFALSRQINNCCFWARAAVLSRYRIW